MRKLMLAGAAVATAACATTAKFEAKMNSFIGQPEAAIVGMYGPPQASYTMGNGARVLQYTRGGTLMMPGAQTMQPVTTNTNGTMTLNRGLQQTTGSYTSTSTTYVPQQTPATPITLWCTVNFTLDASGTVRGWSANGNHCVAD
jgi:hypothetical protein